MDRQGKNMILIKLDVSWKEQQRNSSGTKEWKLDLWREMKREENDNFYHHCIWKASCELKENISKL